MRELVFVRTSGFTGPLILAIDTRFSHLRQDVLSAGALGCLTLPIIPDDLEDALDRVAEQPAPPNVDAGLGLFLAPIDRTARRGHSSVRLGPREFAVLHCLVGKRGRVASLVEIYDYAWGGKKSRKEMRALLQVHISQLRKKLARIGLGKAIKTYRDYGYGL